MTVVFELYEKDLKDSPIHIDDLEIEVSSLHRLVGILNKEGCKVTIPKSLINLIAEKSFSDKGFCPYCDSSQTFYQIENKFYGYICKTCGHEWD